MTDRKAAVISGSFSGIGLSIADGLAAAGMNIAMNGIEAPDQMEPTRRSLEQKHGVRAIYSAANLTKPEGVRSLIAAAKEAFGGIDVLVNNAGIQHVSSVEDFPDEKWEAIISLNLSAAFYATKAVVADMKVRKWGRIRSLVQLAAIVLAQRLGIDLQHAGDVILGDAVAGHRLDLTAAGGIGNMRTAAHVSHHL